MPYDLTMNMMESKKALEQNEKYPMQLEFATVNAFLS